MNTTPTADIERLPSEDAERLLGIARKALERRLRGQETWQPALAELPEALQRNGACFVTLYTHGRLHGCIGSVQPRRPLAWDVASNALSAALDDPRFRALRAEELDDTEIEVSVLSPMQPIAYDDFADLIAQIRPGVDGVLVERGWQRGLLLPQVWEKAPEPHEFLFQVARKADADLAIYTAHETRVYVFQVQTYTQAAPAAVVK